MSMGNMDFKRKLPIPMEVKEKYPISLEAVERKAALDKQIRDVFTGDPRLAAEDGVLLHDEGRRGIDIDLSPAGREGPFPPGGGDLAARLRHRPPAGGRPLELDRPRRL